MNYFIVNSNNKLNPSHSDEQLMLNNSYVAIFDKNADRINWFYKGDIIFLFKNKVGIIGYGRVDGSPKFKELKDGRKQGSQKFTNLIILQTPLSTKEIEKICGPMSFIQSAFKIQDDKGEAIINHLEVGQIRRPHLKLVA